MDARDIQVLIKIREHTQSIREYCAECVSLEDFSKDKMRVEACVFNLMQIGELAKKELSDETKDEISAIPWKQLYGMRNRIVHGYSGVDLSIVWETISDDIPKLDDELKKYVKECV